MSDKCEFGYAHEKHGADRERRRIRRAQAKALLALRAAATVFNRPTLMNIAHVIDAATRAARRRK